MIDARALRILAVTLRYPPYVAGGYELLTGYITDDLAARGHHVEVLAGKGERFADREGVLPWLEPGLDGDGPDARDTGNAERIRLHFFRAENYKATQRALRDCAADVLLFFNLSLVSLAPVLAARNVGVPTLGFVADPWPENHWVREWRAREREAPGKPLRLAALGRAWQVFRSAVDLGRLCVPSAFLRDAFVADGLEPTDLQLLPLGVPPDMAARTERSEPRLREGGEPLRVACTSMWWEGKGQHVLLEAAALACSRGAQLEVHLAGEGAADYRARLEGLMALPALEGGVVLHGRLDREGVSRLLGDVHALVMPSLWGEPFGLTTVEAMAHGLPVVASDAGASPEIVRDGRDGRVVPAGDVEALAAALGELSSDEGLRLALASEARERARTHYSHERFLDGLEAALVGCWREGAR